jgi:hypothetical protein
MGIGTVLRGVMVAAVLSVVAYEFAAGWSHMWCEVSSYQWDGVGCTLEAVCADGVRRNGWFDADDCPDWVWWSPWWGELRQADLVSAYQWSILATIAGLVAWAPLGRLNPREKWHPPRGWRT